MMRSSFVLAALAAILPAQQPVPIGKVEHKPVPIAGKQTEVQPAPRIANALRVTNPARHARYDVVRLNLPWPRGVYRGEPLGVDGHLLQVSPFGLKWEDGSWRYSTVHVPVTLPPATDDSPSRTVLEVGPAPTFIRPPAFEMTPGLKLGLSIFSARLEVGDRSLDLKPTRLIESGHLVICVACEGRVEGTPVWAELRLDARSGCDHVRFWLEYGASQAGPPSWTLPEVRLSVAGVGVRVWHQNAKVLERRTVNGRTVLVLDRGGKWGEGQSQMVSGRFLCVPVAEDASDIALGTFAAEHQAPPQAVATTWARSQAFGSFGVVPEPPEPVTAELVDREAVASYAKHADDPWAQSVHGNGPYPGATGAQPAFGVIALHRPALGWPLELFSVQRSVYQDAIRPVYIREADGSLWRYSNHPRVHVWNRMLFRTSPDNLGKTAETAPWDCRPTQPTGAHPVGRDRQHDVQQPEQEYLLLTADRGAQMLRDQQVELSLAAYTVHSGNRTIDGLEAPRAVGRGLATLSMDYLLTGRDDLRRTIDDRCDMIERTWPGGRSSPLKFLQISGKDGRNLGGRWPFGFFWQDWIGVRGLAAAHAVTGSSSARRVAVECGTSMLGLLKPDKVEGVSWNTPKNVAQVDAVWRNDRWEGIGAVPVPTTGGPPVIEYYAGYQKWCLPGVEALFGFEIDADRPDSATANKARAFAKHVEGMFLSGPAKWAEARRRARWDLARWGAVR